jgi:AcrR family transcriptional regulator
MSKKTAQKAQTSPREAAVRAALALAAEGGWMAVGMHDISEKSGISLPDLHEIFADRYDILAAYGRMLDRRMLEAAGPIDPDTSERDRLFDLLMERFDLLNEDRAGVCAILESFLPDPKQAVISLPHLCRSMAWTLDAAGIGTGGMKGIVRIMGLTGLYLDTLRTWKEDESEDLARTMAALDKNLARAESWAVRFC